MDSSNNNYRNNNHFCGTSTANFTLPLITNQFKKTKKLSLSRSKIKPSCVAVDVVSTSVRTSENIIERSFPISPPLPRHDGTDIVSGSSESKGTDETIQKNINDGKEINPGKIFKKKKPKLELDEETQNRLWEIFDKAFINENGQTLNETSNSLIEGNIQNVGIDCNKKIESSISNQTSCSKESEETLPDILSDKLPSSISIECSSSSLKNCDSSISNEQSSSNNINSSRNEVDEVMSETFATSQSVTDENHSLCDEELNQSFSEALDDFESFLDNVESLIPQESHSSSPLSSEIKDDSTEKLNVKSSNKDDFSLNDLDLEENVSVLKESPTISSTKSNKNSRDFKELCTTPKKNSSDSKELSTTPKKNNTDFHLQFNGIIHGSSPAKREKFSPSIMKSPKKFFGSSVERKRVEQYKTDVSEYSPKRRRKLPFFHQGEQKNQDVNNSQKLISQYFITNDETSTSAGQGNKFNIVGSGSGQVANCISKNAGHTIDTLPPKTIDHECYTEMTTVENNAVLSKSAFYLRIFEDVLSHINDVILPTDGHLFNSFERILINELNNLNDSAKCWYFRLLSRKHNWINEAKLDYVDLIPSMNVDLKKLEAIGFLTSDYSNEDIDVILDLLTVPELKKLCREFRVGDKGKKCNLISNLKNVSEKQLTLHGKHRDPYFVIRKRISKDLRIIKLSPDPRKMILKCLRIYSFSYNMEVEEKLVQLVIENSFKTIYPKFIVKHAVVFHSREYFDDYEKSLTLRAEVMNYIKPINLQTFMERINEARIRFELCMNSESNRDILSRTPDYLMKYTAANVYAGIYFHNINHLLKKDEKYARRIRYIITFLNRLLTRKVFLLKKRGQIYENLIKIHRKEKNYSEAFNTFQRARDDELVPKVIQVALLTQVKSMLRLKAVPPGIKSSIENILKNENDLIDISCFNSIILSAKSLPSDRSHRRKVYVTEHEVDTHLQSVEELVIKHYNKSGWYGIHDEGRLLKSIIIACFWDIIFDSPELKNETWSVFVNKFQMRPLDWGSPKFYTRRLPAIMKRLDEIDKGDWKVIYNRVDECLKKHEGEAFSKSLWKWIYFENLNRIREFLMCISPSFIVMMANWLLHDFGTYSAGFPDCTLWNKTERKCCFVEVKSPNDTIANHQALWLKKIEEFKGNVTICYINEIASCASKLSAQGSNLTNKVSLDQE